MERALFAVAVTLVIASSGGARTLFVDPGPIESLDLSAGPGGRDQAPQAPFTFEKEETGGTAPKVLVRDARGVRWSVKFGPEVHGETFASRIAWAAGYAAEPTYFVADGVITGASGLSRASRFIDGSGRFRDARFELRDDKVFRLVEGQKWSFDDKGVEGSRDLNGLKLLIMLLSNWDVKPGNLAVVETGGQQRLAMIDWGASMGRTGDMTHRSKWDCKAYTDDSQHFINGVEDGYVSFSYAGKARDQVTNNVKVEDVKWFVSRIGKLSDAQIAAALDASGATAEEKSCFIPAFRKRLGQLETAASGTGGGISTTTTRTKTVIKKKTTVVPQP